MPDPTGQPVRFPGLRQATPGPQWISLHQHESPDHKIRAKAFLKAHTPKDDLDWPLSLHLKSLIPKHAGKHHFIDGLQQTWAKLSMQIERILYDDFSNSFLVHLHILAYLASFARYLPRDEQRVKESKFKG